ncbi:MAG: pyridoxal phosphate-dependent aminotransferase [Candidatus Bathyarchaeia archaeon]
MIANRLFRLSTSATAELENQVAALRRQGVTDLIPLGIGEPYCETPDHIRLAAWNALRSGQTRYGPTAGEYELRAAIAEKLRRENGLKVRPEEVVVTAGAKFAIFLVFLAALDPGDAVVIPEPAWVTYQPAAELAGAQALLVPCDEKAGFQPDVKSVKKILCEYNKVKMLILNSPCNPTGAVYTPYLIREIASIAKRQNILLLSDECYEYFIYEGEHYSPASEFDNVVTVNAFSKAYSMTGWRLGYVTGPKELLEGVLKIYQHSLTCVPSFVQAAGIEALCNEKSRKFVNQMVEEHRKRRDLMVELIRRSEFWDLKTVPQGAFYVFPAYKVSIPSNVLAQRLLMECHVATVPGVAFGPSGEGHLRLSYSLKEVALLREAFSRMEDFFKRL